MPKTATVDVIALGTLGDATKIIDIKRKNRLLKVCYVSSTGATFLGFFLFFLL